MGVTPGNRGFQGVSIKLSAILFIDSSNFYHSLKEQNDLPFDADQFASLIVELNKQFDLKEVYFYDAIKDRINDSIGYAKQQRFHDRLKKEVPNIVIRHRKLKYVVSISKKKASEIAKTIDLSVSEDKLYLFLKKLGVIKLTREKGLDVLLVVDALNIHKKDKNKALVILSGDSDYVPAIEYMLSEGANVINLHTYSGSSKELRDACSEHILLDIDVAGNVMLKRYKKLVSSVD